MVVMRRPPFADVEVRPDPALLQVRRLDHRAAQLQPHERPVLAPQPGLAAVGLARRELRVGQLTDGAPGGLVLELDEARAPDELARAPAEQLLELAVDPAMLAVHREADADQRALQDRLALRERALQARREVLARGDVRGHAERRRPAIATMLGLAKTKRSSCTTAMPSLAYSTRVR
jgi:hypothetical protein